MRPAVASVGRITPNLYPHFSFVLWTIRFHPPTKVRLSTFIRDVVTTLGCDLLAHFPTIVKQGWCPWLQTQETVYVPSQGSHIVQSSEAGTILDDLIRNTRSTLCYPPQGYGDLWF